MDYITIARMTDPETARKLQSESYFDNHIAGHRQTIDGDGLDELTRGAVILGVDPVDYPLTDGIYIYIKLPAGDVIALLIESNGQGGDYETLRISKTTIK